MYEADDGSKFYSENQCIEYEKQCADVIEANTMLANGSSLLDVLKHANRSWTDWGKSLSQEDREILSKITTDTGFSVRHWQCRAEPGYKPRAVNVSGQIWLFGDAGSWSGSYGNWVSLTDLFCYYRDTIFSMDT